MRSRSPLPFVAAVLLLPACDATGPDERELRVTLSVDASAPTVSMTSDTLRVECVGTFRATATGASGDVAIWRGGARRWFVGLDRTTPVQVDSMPGQEAIEFWQLGRLAVGDTAEAGWRFWAGAPFIIELEFSYQSSGGGPVRNTATTMECGLGEDVPTAPAPVIHDVTLETPTPFQPGDAFTVSYHASGSAGLWQTAIVIDGAYQAIHTTTDSLRTESQQSVRLVVPQGVSLGRPLDISVQAMDALGQTSAPVRRHSGPLVDQTPPHFNWVVLHRIGEAMGGEIRMVGQYAVGDSIPFLVGAWDNQALGNATIDIGADRRITPLSPYESAHEIHLRADAGWLGHQSLAIEVSDAVGHVGGRYSAHPDSFAIYPAVDRPVVSWSARQFHRDAAWDDARDLLYLTLDSVPEIVVLSTATMTVTRTIPMPGYPAGIDLTVSGEMVAVVLQNRGSFAVVDLITDQLTEYPLGGVEWERVLNVAVLADNTALVEMRDAQGGMHVLRVALENGNVLSDTNVPGDDLRMARPRDRAAVGLYSWTSLHTCLVIYTAATDSYSPCRANRSPPSTLASDPTGSRFIMAAHITDAAADAVTHPIWGIKPHHWSASTFSADGESIFVSDTRGLFRIRVSDGLVLERVPLRIVYGSLLTSADGSRLIGISNDGDDRFATVYRVMLR